MPASVRFLFYAINGTGLGHLSRCLAIGRALRELAHGLGLAADIQMLTTSEAPEVAFDFPVYKIPSKTVVAGSDTPGPSFVATAKALIANVVANVRPDVLVLDTVAEGSFSELTFIRDFARKTAFIYRHRDATLAAASSHQSHLALYDRILVPDEEPVGEATDGDGGRVRRYPVPARVASRVRFCGRVHGLRPERALTREEVRRSFGITPARDAETSVVYVSAGGGGDPRAARDLDAIIDATASDPRRVVLVGYGPLHRGERRYAPNVIPLGEADVSRYFAGLDAAVSAAGYNTYEELLAAGVPSLFFAQDKGLDRQDERIAAGLADGLHGHLVGLDPVLIRRGLAEVTEPSRALAIRERLAARAAASRDGAIRAALELLDLHATLPRSPVDRRALHTVTALREAWVPRPEPTFEATLAHGLTLERAAARDHAIDDLGELARRALAGERDDNWRRRATDLLESGRRLADAAERLGWSVEEVRRLATAVLADAHDDPTVAARRRVLVDALESLGAALPGDEAAALLGAVRARVRRADLSFTLEALREHADAASPGAPFAPRVEALAAGESDRKLDAEAALSALGLTEETSRR